MVLYTYPKDFTFVCPTEILELDRRRADFAERSAVILGASTDNEPWPRTSAFCTRRRRGAPRDIIVDPERVVRFSSANDLGVGRNVDEVLRVLDALQTGELVACNWQ